MATRALKELTPYELYRSRRPNIAHLRVFGCIRYVKIEGMKLKKLDDRSLMLVHLGTEPGSKSYRLYDPKTRKIKVSRDVVFDETRGWNWSKESSETHNDRSFFTTIGSHGNHGMTENEASSTSNQLPNSEDVEAIRDGDDTETCQEEEEIDGEVTKSQTLRRSERQISTPKYLEDYFLLAEELGEEILLYLNGEPRSFGEAKDSREWTKACEEEIESIEKNKTWILVDLPYGAKPIGLKWVLKIKRNSDGSINKFKARLVAKGYVYRHGIDFDEVFAPVGRIERIRLLVNLAATNGWEVHHLDVKTAFLHGELKETVYVTQPEGYKVKGCENKVYKLNKALYGLRQGPRAWNNKLNVILCELGFKKCSKEPSVYRKALNGDLLVVVVYVDDLFVTGTNKMIIDEFNNNMSTKFDMSDLGKLIYYLGIEVCQNESGIHLNQRRYATKILEDAGMIKCNPLHTPMELGVKFPKLSMKERSTQRSIERMLAACDTCYKRDLIYLSVWEFLVVTCRVQGNHVGTEILTVDFHLNKETRKTLISQRSRISARANDK